jgi:hypothetical protein
MIGLMMLAAASASSPALFDKQVGTIVQLCRWEYGAKTPAEGEQRRLLLVRRMSRQNYQRLDEDCQIWLMGRAEQFLASNPH